MSCADQPKSAKHRASNIAGTAGTGASSGKSNGDAAGAGTSGDDVGAAGSNDAAGAAGSDDGGSGNSDAGGADSGAGATNVAGSPSVAGGAGATSTAGAGGAGSVSFAGAPNNDAPAKVVVKVNYGTVRQKIDGFGVATSWATIPPAVRLDAFFSVSKGAGLSILRNRIPFREAPNNNDNFMGGGDYNYTITGSDADAYKTFTLNWNNWDLTATRKLIATLKANADYQLSTCFSSPWTPPNNGTSRWKLGVADYVNAPEVGGYLDPAHYQDYADLLADYALGFEGSMGMPLNAISLQNEPNFKASYESADWSAEQLHAFLTALHAEFDKKGVFGTLPNLTILAPEDPNFKEDLILPSLADSDTASLIGIVAAHQYEFGPWNATSYAPKPLSASLAAGKKVWVTEWNTDAFTGKTPLATALLLAGLIEADLTTASVSAYVHWWYKDLVDTAGAPNKNLWAIGQFSRFVRPGFSLVDAPSSVGSNVQLAAFKDPAGSQLTVVVVNRGSVDSTFALELDSGTLGAITSFRTSVVEDLKSLGSTPSGGTFANVMVPAQSISTFVIPVTPDDPVIDPTDPDGGI